MEENKQLVPVSCIKQERYLIVPLQAEEEEMLNNCEQTIAAGLADFVRVGNALMVIQERKLYRATHHTFENYCQQRWGLQRRTGYQKIEVAQVYENVRSCAQILPINENQLRPLVSLPVDKQQAVWKQAAAGETPPTGKQVREAVRALQVAQTGSSINAYLMPDPVFPGIPFRFEINPAEWVMHGTSSVVFMEPGKATMKSPVGVTVKDVQLVLVSPDSDLSADANAEVLFEHLLSAMAAAPQYRFLIWGRDLTRMQAITMCPPNVELVMQVSQQTDVDQLQALKDSPFPPQALWVLPNESLRFPTPLPYNRVLVGDTAWPPGEYTTEEISTCRQLLARLLDEVCALHLSRTVDVLLGRASVYHAQKSMSVTVTHAGR